jgi:hypothetical protein
MTRLFAERGYHAVVQSTRGTFGSGPLRGPAARNRDRVTSGSNPRPFKRKNEIDADRLGAGVAGVLAARSEAELAEVVLPLVRLDVTTNIGRVHLRHPGTGESARRWPGGRRRR